MRKAGSFAANAANGQVGASIFEDIQGYDDLQDAEGSKAAQLSGLTVVDDTTLKVKLKASNSAFLYKIGDVAFLPMPSEVIKNPKEYGQKTDRQRPVQAEGVQKRRRNHS